jgi:hypothetical protein
MGRSLFLGDFYAIEARSFSLLLRTPPANPASASQRVLLGTGTIWLVKRSPHARHAPRRTGHPVANNVPGVRNLKQDSSTTMPLLLLSWVVTAPF